ncbi:Hypothetical predicted protein [Olea europaea subsp. europaea]|uniref:Uncharacterized protein n=1 Tax=Olea europaea subsp. europaea TaxID=158383 RepID=A0A8S0PRY0_OLEEU|nr:Hypothetical predicted protein [Olea europaea subsp. europaea]
MKGSCTLVASVVAASTAAALSSFATGGRDVTFNPASHQSASINSLVASSEKNKFAPRFDGLRFIETLVTAHR